MSHEPFKQDFWRNVLFALVALSLLIQLGFEWQKQKSGSVLPPELITPVDEEAD